MASFNNAVRFVLAKEGGYQAHQNDSGNYNSRKELVGTNYGISAVVLERHIKRPPTVEDMKNLTVATAKAIYKKNYWEPIQGDNILHESTAIAIFDWFVNAGRPAIFNAQKVAGVTQDGIVGRITLKALNSMNPKVFFEQYQKERVDWYNRLTQRRPTLQVFLRGWINRIQSLTNYITKKTEDEDKA